MMNMARVTDFRQYIITLTQQADEAKLFDDLDTIHIRWVSLSPSVWIGTRIYKTLNKISEKYMHKEYQQTTSYLQQ